MPNYLQIQRADPVASGLAAFGAVQDIGNRQTQNALNQMKLQQEQRRQNALAQYGRDRNVEGLYQSDPELAMQAEKFVAAMKTEKRQALADNIKIFDARKGLYVDNPEAYAEDYKSVDPDFQKSLMSPEKFAKLAPAERQDALFKKEQITRELSKALTPYQAGMLEINRGKADLYGRNVESQIQHRGTLEGMKAHELGLKESELNLKRGEAARKAGEKPSFAYFQQDPSIAVLPKAEQVRRYNQSIAEGRSAGKVVDPLKAAKAKTEEKKAVMLERFGAKPKTSAESAPAGQQYMLPKGGVMVPVTKEVYDAYQAHYGQK